MRHLALAIGNAAWALRGHARIGPLGVVARACVGLTLIALAVLWTTRAGPTQSSRSSSCRGS